MSEHRRDAVATAGLLSALCIAAAAVMAGPVTAHAETLNEALAAAYANNPIIAGERAQARAVDEELPEAQSGFRPSVTANADYGISSLRTGVADFRNADGSAPSDFQILANKRQMQRNDGTTHPGGVSIVLSQPIFNGFQTLSAVRQAEANIGASRARLHDTEQSLLFDSARAYTDVVRDGTVVRLRENNLKVLSSELQATRERFAAGAMTRTDVSQALARRAGALAELDRAKADLRASLAEYERMIGHPAENLKDPRPLGAELPATLDEALAIADAESPEVNEATFLEEASEHEITFIEGEYLPHVRLDATHQERFETNPWVDQQQSQSIIARMSMPLYSSGDIEARVRQAKHRRHSRLQAIEEARQQSRARTIAAWAQLNASRGQYEAVSQQVRASEDALNGVREEQAAGQRTLLDVLDAERELVEAEVAQAHARRDLVLVSYNVLGAIGRLTARQLNLDVALYDAEQHTRVVDRLAWGYSVEEVEGYEGYWPASEQGTE